MGKLSDMSDSGHEEDDESIYPGGRCSEAKITIDSRILGKLQAAAGRRHVLKGAYTLDPVPVACIRATSESQFRALKKQANGILSWIWPTPFGRFTSYSIVPPTVGKKSQPLARMFVPSDEAFSESVYTRGVLYFFVIFQGKHTRLYKADFSTGARGGLDALSKVRTENTESVIYHDNELSYWLALGFSDNSNWRDQLTDRDQFSIGWAQAAYKQLSRLHSGFLEGGHFPHGRPMMSDTDDTKLLQTKFPYIHSVLVLLSDPSASNDKILSLLKEALIDNALLEELVYRRMAIAGQIDGVPDELLQVFDQYFIALQLTSEATEGGIRRLWIDASKNPMEVNYLDLNPSLIKVKNQRYWDELEQFPYPFDLGVFISSDDAPIPTTMLWQSLEDMNIDCAENEAYEAINMLLDDAVENQQWTIPWGAKVQLNLPDFPFVEFFQIENEVYCLFRNIEDLYFIASMNLKTKNWMIPNLFKKHSADEDDAGNLELNIGAELAIATLLATIIRDFMVVQEREQVFGCRRIKGNRRRKSQVSIGLTVIYLPRIQYKHCNPSNYLDGLPQTERSRHEVRPHLRKAAHTSKEQLWLAHRYSISVPRGYTFVRPHARGGLDAKKKTIYRSRSAASLIYNITENSAAGEAEWFKFERDVAQYMKAKGFTVQHQSVNRNGDGGVDVYAYEELFDEIWAIQCKCYAAHHSVGPNVIRELYGSLHAYPEGTKGMVITTSSFTAGAIKEAERMGIKLVDGDEFSKEAQALGFH